jgi:hypothetical protein
MPASGKRASALCATPTPRPVCAKIGAAVSPRAPQIARESLEHQPDEAGWRAAMQPLHDALAPISGAGAHAAMAREEYLLGGQEGLDELLAALGGGGGGELVRAPGPPAGFCPELQTSLQRSSRSS